MGLILLHLIWRYYKGRKMRKARDKAAFEGPVSRSSSRVAESDAATRVGGRQKRAGMTAPTAKPARVYPTNAEGRAEDTRNNAAQAAKDAGGPKALSPEDMARIGRLVQHLRPGMRVEDIDALSEPSDGLLTRESLSSDGKWRAGQRPCTAVCIASGDRAGEINVVDFPAAFADPESVGEYGSPEALLAEIPGAARAYRTVLDEKQHRVVIDLPDTGGDFLARVHYLKGSFHQTEYRLAEFAHRYDAVTRKMDEARRAEKAAEAAKREAWAMLPLDEKLSKVRVPRREQVASQGVDGALRAWAGGEGSEHWRPFVEWLILDSTPDDRHTLVDMNWDGHPIALFLWILQQPDTDIATAAKIIWQAGTAFYLNDLSQSNGTSLSNDYHLERLDLAIEAAERIRAGFYEPKAGHAPIASDGPPVPIGVSDDPRRRAIEDRLVPAEIRAPIPGRSESDVPFKVPERYWELLN